MEIAASSCPVCSGSAWSRDLVAGRILGLSKPYTVLLCGTCGQRRLNPQLSEKELQDLYSGSYFNSKAASSNSQSDAKVSTSDYLSEVAPGRHAKFLKTIKTIRRINPDARTLLDVGAATGDLVRIARQSGLDAEGIELSDAAIAMANAQDSLKLERLTLGEVQKDEFYDCLHLNHVFEHFNEPVKELVQIHRLLKKEGLLYIEVPYQFNVVERSMFRLSAREGEFTVHSLHHPFFYTPKSISRLLDANGFEVLECSVFDPIRYDAATFRAKAKKLVWWMLAKVAVGNHIEIYARRKS
jgi:SAM-dependent methyltransferase